MNEVAESFRNLHPILQAMLAGVFTWAITALGAALVLFTRQVGQRTLDLMEDSRPE
jgi:zinc transporter, ZIP family